MAQGGALETRTEWCASCLTQAAVAGKRFSPLGKRRLEKISLMSIIYIGMIYYIRKYGRN